MRESNAKEQNYRNDYSELVCGGGLRRVMVTEHTKGWKRGKA